MNQSVASLTMVEIARTDAEGKVLETLLLLDPRERSAHVVKQVVAGAWARLPTHLQTLETLVKLLTDQYGFMRAAKLIHAEVETGVVEMVPASAPKSDAAWNWKGVHS